MDDVRAESLREARKHLMIAGTIIYNSAIGVQDFRTGKFLNVLGKETQQLSTELSVFLDEVQLTDMDFPLQNMPSLHILRAMKGEG